jgi:RNA polymerase sigma factor (sigma-70 family)
MQPLTLLHGLSLDLMTKSIHIEEIIQGCKDGNSDCQKALFKKFASKMLGICLRYCNNYDAAKDAMQEGFIKVFKNLSSFKGNSAFETWMTRIMINCALNELKKSNRFGYFEDFADTPDNPYHRLDNAPGVIEKMSHEELLTILQELPTGFRTVFNMYAIEGFSHREIAEYLGINEGTSKSQLNRARKVLQEKIMERVKN